MIWWLAAGWVLILVAIVFAAPVARWYFNRRRRCYGGAMADERMSPDDARALQARLIELFEQYGLKVGVGLTKHGVAIRSQDDRVDAADVGQIWAAMEHGFNEADAERYPPGTPEANARARAEGQTIPLDES